MPQSIQVPIVPLPLAPASWATNIATAPSIESMPMTTPITLKDITIHPVVEQQGAFFERMGFFPTLTKELFEENRSWLQPAFVDRR